MSKIFLCAHGKIKDSIKAVPPDKSIAFVCDPGGFLSWGQMAELLPAFFNSTHVSEAIFNANTVIAGIPSAYPIQKMKNIAGYTLDHLEKRQTELLSKSDCACLVKERDLLSHFLSSDVLTCLQNGATLFYKEVEITGPSQDPNDPVTRATLLAVTPASHAQFNVMLYSGGAAVHALTAVFDTNNFTHNTTITHLYISLLAGALAETFSSTAISLEQIHVIYQPNNANNILEVYIEDNNLNPIHPALNVGEADYLFNYEELLLGSCLE